MSMYRNNSQGYGLVAILFHWLSALTIISLFALGFWMVELNYYSEWYRTGPYIHKSVGLILLALTIMRVIWRLMNPEPNSLSNNVLENKAAKYTHKALYISLFIILISGYLISTADGRGIEVFDWVIVPSLGELFNEQEDIAGLLHQYTAYFIIVLALIHGLAALKHHFINRDNTLTRMLKPSINRNH